MGTWVGGLKCKLPNKPDPHSSYSLFQVCPSVSTWSDGVILAPPYYTIYIEQLYYGVTDSSPRCQPYNPSHCTVPAPILCNLQDRCEYKYVNDLVVECGNTFADYTFGKYRFVPKESTNTFSIREELAISLDQSPFGILTSDGYPKYEEGVTDETRLVTLDLTKSIRVIVTDLLIGDTMDSGCLEGVLQVDDGLSGRNSWCGAISLQSTYEFVTCSEILTVSYKTSKGFNQGERRRGFRAYFELIDKPASCYGSTSRVVTTQEVTTIPNDQSKCCWFNSFLSELFSARGKNNYHQIFHWSFQNNNNRLLDTFHSELTEYTPFFVPNVVDKMWSFLLLH